jgi:hypothetical protein
MKLLDGRPEVEKYSHFGAFRSNETTVGPSAAFLDASGKLTDTGSWYLGGGAAPGTSSTTGTTPTAGTIPTTGNTSPPPKKTVGVACASPK